MTDAAKAISDPPPPATSAAAVAAASKEENSKLFVFGENLTDRAANVPVRNGEGEGVTTASTSDQEAAPEGSASSTSEAGAKPLPTTGPPVKEKTKTLSESAAEYFDTRNKKVEYGEVELITGEENEINAFQMSAKVKIIFLLLQ